MKFTKRELTLTFKDYGELVIPKGTQITNQTAMGIDPAYNFVNDFSWVPRHADGLKQYGLLHDLKYSGLNIPLEEIEEL